MKKVLFAVFVILLFYTRFAGIEWGLPYPMHPDERNMAVAVQSLHCNSLNAECFNPHFFAYGQLTLYAAFASVWLLRLFTGISTGITFVEATLSLRMISAMASIFNALVLLKIVYLIVKKTRWMKIAIVSAGVLAIFSPYFIQFSHFGTTESLLMLFYSLIAWVMLQILHTSRLSWKHLVLLGVFFGLAVATKISSLIFLGPVVLLIVWKLRRTPLTAVKSLTLIILVSGIVALIASPHNLISYAEFSSSLQYESAVGLGTYQAFYTRQFTRSIPVLFQIEKTFPYALGLLQFVLAMAGFLFLSWKNKNYNALRLFVLFYFIPTSFIFAKWSRFSAPVFPFMTLFAVLFLGELPSLITANVRNIKPKIASFVALLLLIGTMLPGVAYLTIYLQPDIRFKASEWIYENIPANSKILSETANVVDIPILTPGAQQKAINYQYASFDFYHLDEDLTLQAQLAQFVRTADYIIVPSRRIFANHQASDYPRTAAYYDNLFSGSLGYKQVAVFSTPFIGLSDETAEETWSVFDHPVIRIYKKMVQAQEVDETMLTTLKSYKRIRFPLRGSVYTLLVADTPEKRQQGLMFVRSKKNIDGADGMIFMFDDKDVRHFWNKNTVADLDVYWLKNSEIIGTDKLPSIEKSKTISTITSPDGVDSVVEIISPVATF